ncbi:thiamine phosphate synthase [Sphingomonas sp. KR1UV-12]|uniref:Thiamine phosphate synthase n=1 Tax=Sphingomonas aurea TaxID=3063994 RepID=A0ABT9ELV4_9SPHN|nr:thiamine phosphate synthase [Sphingomonas sp. KR1UV-12]MDP1027802.1 thiamine phosphate synthase [Sphingomonas sp. KR1UV-12]
MAHAYPECWLMTDERAGDALWTSLRALPPGAGVVFRHHATPPAERRALFLRVRRIAAARRLLLLASNPPLPGAAGLHGRIRGATSWPAHDRRQALAARRAGARLLFLSPAFATRSHPGAAPTGPARLARIGRDTGLPMIALGGMTPRRYRRVRALGFTGWAAIDAWR